MDHARIQIGSLPYTFMVWVLSSAWCSRQVLGNFKSWGTVGFRSLAVLCADEGNQETPASPFPFASLLPQGEWPAFAPHFCPDVLPYHRPQCDEMDQLWSKPAKCEPKHPFLIWSRLAFSVCYSSRKLTLTTYANCSLSIVLIYLDFT